MHAWNIPTYQLLTSQLRSAKLPHALLITGVKGSGKKALSDWLIKVSQCQQPIIDQNQIFQPCQQCKMCHLIQSNTNPDVLALAHDERTMSVDEVRKASSFLETRPQLANGKAVLIAHADKMTTSAANALLKTLEEPAEGGLLILYCEERESLLPTITSRCQSIDLRPYVGQALAEATQSKIQDPYLNLKQIQAFKEPEQVQQFMMFLDTCKPVFNQYQLQPEFEQALIQNEQAFAWFELIIVNLMREQNCWLVADNIVEIESKWSQNELWQLYQLVIAMKKKLKSLLQANPTFLKEKLLADINRILSINEV